ncbi:MAG: hypothetical protein MIO90_04685 [Methanomassiliicoccales archaeon]|nr:hypothetical protein [Methanomassiliicoccales archaeon]
MGFVQTQGSTHAQRTRMSPACVASLSPSTDAGGPSLLRVIAHPPSCRPWLHARYGASVLLWRL